MLIQLPNGLLDGQDLFNFAEIDELRGKQQNYLANRELVVGNIGHVPKILEDCVLALQTKEGMKWNGQMSEAIYKLSSGDLETLLIAVRHNTYGERFYFEADCPHCNHKNKNLRLDLDKLEKKIMSVEDMVNKQRLTRKLPKSGLEVELKPVYLKDLFEVLKILKGKQDELVTSVTALSLRRIGDNQKVTPKDIDNLSVKDLDYLKKELEDVEIEGTIDTNITQACTNCGKDFDTKLDVFTSDFYDPTRGSMSTPT